MVMLACLNVVINQAFIFPILDVNICTALNACERELPGHLHGDMWNTLFSFLKWFVLINKMARFFVSKLEYILGQICATTFLQKWKREAEHLHIGNTFSIIWYFKHSHVEKQLSFPLMLHNHALKKSFIVYGKHNIKACALVRPVNGPGRAWAWVVQSHPGFWTGLWGVVQSQP